MPGASSPAFEMIRALRDDLQRRISESEDFQALLALNRRLQDHEAERRMADLAAAPALADPPRPNPFSYPDVDGLVSHEDWWRRHLDFG